MGLFGKIFGGSLEATLQANQESNYGDAEISGMLNLKASDDTVITKIKFDFARIKSTTSTVSPDEVSDIKTLGSVTLSDRFEMKADESKEVPFSIPIDWTKTELKGLNKAIMDVAKVTESAQFLVTAQIKIKGAVTPKNVDQTINITNTPKFNSE